MEETKQNDDNQVNKAVSKPQKKAIKSTYSDLDWSSTDDDYNDIIKGPSPPPRKVRYYLKIYIVCL